MGRTKQRLKDETTPFIHLFTECFGDMQIVITFISKPLHISDTKIFVCKTQIIRVNWCYRTQTKYSKKLPLTAHYSYNTKLYKCVRLLGYKLTLLYSFVLYINNINILNKLSLQVTLVNQIFTFNNIY